VRRILHVSDVHFGPLHQEDRRHGVERLVAERRPDVLVVSGDLTQRAKPHQFRAARAWLDAFDVPTLAVPGNHDVPMYRFWERFGAPFGAWRKHFARELEPTWADEELFVVGVNSAYNWTIENGRLTAARLRELDGQFAAAPAGACRVAVVHHELMVAPGFVPRRALRNARAGVESLARSGVELVLSGHLHQAWAGSTGDEHPGVQPSFHVVFSGTTTSSRGRGTERGRNSCNWIEVDDERIRVTKLLWEGASSGFEPVEQVDLQRRGGAPRSARR
jgi:3',5'-cyclic AMP phosphodiesterase CpdA